MQADKPTAITVSREARDELRSLAAVATGLMRSTVTQTDALRAAVRLAHKHPDEYRAELAAGNGPE